jgi:F-type H+-transporting ATPase subunit c
VVEERRGGCGGDGIAKNEEDRRMVRKIGTITAMVTTAIIMSPLFALAQDVGTSALLQHPLRAGLIAISANIGIGIAAFGSAIGQGRMAAAAMESIGRNPNSAGQIFTPMIIGLAFIEALTLYALVIAFFLQAKI